jgi:hypothetical protein
MVSNSKIITSVYGVDPQFAWKFDKVTVGNIMGGTAWKH